MPARPPKLTHNMTRLPKGARRDDYTDEALVEFDRNRWRKYKRRTRKQQRHRGKREVTIAFGKDAWAEIDRRQAADPNLTLVALFTHLLLE